MRKRNVIVMVIVIIGAVALAAAGAGYYYSSNSASTGETNTSGDELEASYPKTAFYFWVNSLGSWNGSIQGSDFPQQNFEGSGSRFIESACSPGGTYNTTMQSRGTDQELTVTAVWITLPDKDEMTPEQWDKITHTPGLQRPIVLKNETTSADYGAVTVSGTC
jgi:hypothetical protein